MQFLAKMMDRKARTSPLASMIKNAAARAERDKAAAEGERLFRADFEAVARRQAREELQRMESCFQKECDSFNASDKPLKVPDLSYDVRSRVLDADKYALSLNIADEGYEITAVVGVHPDAQRFADPPEVISSQWKLRASADDDGFFWLDTLSGNRFTSEQFSIVAMDELGELLTAYVD